MTAQEKLDELKRYLQNILVEARAEIKHFEHRWDVVPRIITDILAKIEDMDK